MEFLKGDFIGFYPLTVQNVCHKTWDIVPLFYCLYRMNFSANLLLVCTIINHISKLWILQASHQDVCLEYDTNYNRYILFDSSPQQYTAIHENATGYSFMGKSTYRFLTTNLSSIHHDQFLSKVRNYTNAFSHSRSSFD